MPTPRSVRPRTARDFTHSITFAEWRALTRLPWLIGAGAGMGGLLAGLILGALSKGCGP